MDRASKLSLAGILILCLLLRLALVFYHGDKEIRSDAAAFYEIACNIADGKGFSINYGLTSGDTRPSAHGYVVYPYFLAALLYLFDASLLGIGVAHAIIDTITCFLVFLIARRLLGGGIRAGLFAALAYALYPPFIFSTGTVMTETLNTFVMTALAYVLILAMRRGLWYQAAAGLMMGFAILSKPALMAFPLVFALLYYINRRTMKSWLPKAALFVVFSYLAVSPWTIRNYMLMHKFIPVTTHFGMSFWGGAGPADGVCLGGPGYPVDTKERNLYNHNPLIPYVSEETFQRITTFQQSMQQMDEVERDRALRTEAIKVIKAHPVRYLLLIPKKFVRFWFNLWYDHPGSLASKGLAVINAFLLVMAVIGWRRKDTDQALKSVSLVVILYHTALYSIIYGSARFAYPIMPLVIILAAGFVSQWSLFARKTKQAQA